MRRDMNYAELAGGKYAIDLLPFVYVNNVALSATSYSQGLQCY